MVKITNYQNGKIYVITSKLDRTMKYIGSTCNSLSMRLANHRAASKLDKNKNLKIYEYFNNVGWINAEISLLEACPCKSKMELLMKEREFKDKLNPPLNIRNPFRSEEEKMQYDRQFHKQHYKQHTEEIKQQMKQYYKKHAEEIKQHQKQYDMQNAEKKKKYYKEHAEKIKQQMKKYHDQHKTKVQCQNCLKTILSTHLEKHMETKTCQEQYFRTKYAFDDCSNEPYNLNYIE